MANILKNVDKIITTAQTVVDLDNIQAAGGGATLAKITLSSSVTDYYFGKDITFNTVTYPMLSHSHGGGTAQVTKGEYSIDGGAWTQFTSGGTNASFTINETAVVDKNSAPVGYSEQKTIAVRMTDDLGNVSYKEMSITMEHLSAFQADYLLVAGGGAGGAAAGAGSGGGAGGLIIGQKQITLGDNLYVEIGNGGTGIANTGNYSTQIYPGGNSTFDTLIAIGGGGGTYGMKSSMAAYDSGFNKGGSGGGGEGGYSDYGGYGYNTTNAAAWGNPSSMTNQGNDGAAGSSYPGNYYGGGGGGAGSAGGDGSSTTRTNQSIGPTGQNGGDGLSSDITGSTAWYAGGGAGGSHNGGGGSGGSGVGGQIWQSGAANTGSGGGGSAGSVAQTPAAGNGGSGVLILLVPTTVELDVVDASFTINGSGGSTTPPAPQTGRNGDNLYIFRAGSGNISFKSI